jgi:ubiquinone/menaquinone biosynthesis C-methylase UbiE
VRGAGTVYDLGCGPGGQTTAFLHALGADVRGMDLSPAGVTEAGRRHPGIVFETGDMLALPLPDEAAAGILAFYSIVHFSPDQLRTAVTEMHRVMRTGAPLLLAFHVGEQVVHVDEMFGRRAYVFARKPGDAAQAHYPSPDPAS